MSGKATVADAKACWESTPNPSVRLVAKKLTAAGKAVSFKTVAQWKRQGWPGADNPNAAAEKAAKEATRQLEPVVAQATGNANATAAGLPVNPDTDQKNSAITERSLRTLILGAERVALALIEQAPTLLLTQPEGVAKALVAISAAV